MKETKLRKLLRTDPECNPYCDKFKLDKYREKIKQVITNESIHDGLLNSISIIPFINENYTTFYDYIKDLIKNINIPYNSLIDLMFAIFNRNYFLIGQQISESFKDEDGYNQKTLFSFKIPSLDPKMEKFEAQSILEAEVEAMNVILNYIRYFQKEPIAINPIIPEIESINKGLSIMMSSIYFAILKEEYLNAIWDNGHLETDVNGNKPLINITFPDHEKLITTKIGILRLQRNTTSNFIFLMSEIKNKSSNGKYLSELVKKRNNQKRIKRTWIENGEIKYRLAKGFGDSEVLLQLTNIANYLTNYPFLDNIKLPNLDNIELLDLLTLFSLLQELLHEVTSVKYNDEIKNINHLKKFPIKISIEDLMKYFEQRTYYRKRHIRIFIDLISGKFGDRIDTWNKPLLHYGSSLYIQYLPILNPILTHLIDFWIEKGGYSLSERGMSLENYLSEKLSNILLKKGYKYTIPEKKKFEVAKNTFEEIDLIINLKTTIIVAEVKCIKFPYYAKDKHNAFKTLSKAADQIIRKTEFLRTNLSYFEKIIGETSNKEIIPLIITNYPIYSEYQILGIPITDFNLFESFFEAGKMSDAIIPKKGNIDIFNEHRYYQNENEMNIAVKSFFKKSYPIQELRKLFEIISLRITIEDFDYHVFVTSAQINENSFNRLLKTDKELAMNRLKQPSLNKS